MTTLSTCSRDGAGILSHSPLLPITHPPCHAAILGLPEPLETASTLHLTLCTIKGRQITGGITGKRWRGKQRLHGAPQASSARQSNTAYVLQLRALGTVIGLQWLPSWEVSKSGRGWNSCRAPTVPGSLNGSSGN